MSYYRILKSDYDEMVRSVMELAAVTAKLRAELDAERALNARLMAMDFRPVMNPPPQGEAGNRDMRDGGQPAQRTLRTNIEAPNSVTEARPVDATAHP